ncbi:unnamed protein product, partial [Effrenium voratum]
LVHLKPDAHSRRAQAAGMAAQGRVGQSHVLGHNGSQMTLAQNSATRRALAASVTHAALERARAEREAPLSTLEHRQKEARAGLNQLGLSSVPKAKAEKGWAWCVQGRQTPDISGLQKAASLADLRNSEVEVVRGLCRAEGFAPCPEGERPFYGESRAHGEELWDGRMRGGELARNGWAGTFPLNHQRGCMPWAS